MYLMEGHVVLFYHVRIVRNITMAVTVIKTMMMESAFGFRVKEYVIQRNWWILLELISIKNVTVMFILTKHEFLITFYINKASIGDDIDLF